MIITKASSRTDSGIIFRSFNEPKEHKRTITTALTAAMVVMFGTSVVFGADGPDVCDSGATAWMLTSTALVLLMIPGLAMFYGGLVRSKNVLGTMMHSFAAMGVISVLWITCGYAMAFGKGALGGWIGWDTVCCF